MRENNIPFLFHDTFTRSLPKAFCLLHVAFFPATQHMCVCVCVLIRATTDSEVEWKRGHCAMPIVHPLPALKGRKKGREERAKEGT